MNRKVRLLLLTLIVGMLMTFVSGSAFATAPQVATPALAPRSGVHNFQQAACTASGVLIGTPTCKQRLADAQKRWPDAGVSLTGEGHGFGKFIVPDTKGDFQLITISGSIVQSHSPTGPSGLSHSAVQASLNHNSSQAYCGNYYTVTVYASGSWWMNNEQFQTVTYVRYCYYAWYHWSDGYCWGAGQCGTKYIGHDGDWSSQVHHWDDQYVWMWNCCTILWHLGVFVNNYNGIYWYAYTQ